MFAYFAPHGSRRWLGLAAPFALAALSTGASAQAVPALYDGSNTTYQVTPGSNLRNGEGLTSRIVVTLWQGASLKGAGTCSQVACPVVYDGQNLFARRTRLRLPGGTVTPGGGGGSTVISRTLRRGDSGNEVLLLQDALNRAGARLTVDSNYGRGTVSAVENFQRSKGLNADGVAGPATLQALGIGGGGGTTAGGGASGQITRTLRRGDNGNDVLVLQDALNRAGARLTVDRTYGRGTRDAVENFQRSKGLKADGVAGPDTLRALGV